MLMSVGAPELLPECWDSIYITLTSVHNTNQITDLFNYFFFFLLYRLTARVRSGFTNASNRPLWLQHY